MELFPIYEFLSSSSFKGFKLTTVELKVLKWYQIKCVLAYCSSFTGSVNSPTALPSFE